MKINAEQFKQILANFDVLIRAFNRDVGNSEKYRDEIRGRRESHDAIVIESIAREKDILRLVLGIDDGLATRLAALESGLDKLLQGQAALEKQLMNQLYRIQGGISSVKRVESQAEFEAAIKRAYLKGKL